MGKNKLEVLSAWDEVIKNKTIWEYMNIEKSKLYFKNGNENIFLTSFKNEDLPASQYKLTLIGNILTKLSTFANVMYKRPGTEEVTFYSMINTPQPGCFGTYVDKKILSIVSPPITWRREEVENIIKKTIKKYIFEYKESFAFVDIGCGGGFDGLEIERILLGMRDVLGENILQEEYKILNIDIDSKWLYNNEILSKSIFGENSIATRYNMSIFEYLDKKYYKKDLSEQKNLIVSCNGFAEFLNDEELKKLYIGIRDMAAEFSGRVSIILPFSNKNKQQENLGNKIGFKFRAKEKKYMVALVKEIFVGYKISFNEKYSQIVFSLEKVRRLQ